MPSKEDFFRALEQGSDVSSCPLGNESGQVEEGGWDTEQAEMGSRKGPLASRRQRQTRGFAQRYSASHSEFIH